MKRRYGPWTILYRKTIFQNPWFKLVQDKVTRPDGKPGTYTVVHIIAGVSVLPIDDNGFVYLTKEFKYATGRVELETVSGGINRKESAQSTAKRELKEELGINAKKMTNLGTVNPFTATVLSPATLFIARKLSFEKARPEGTERITSIKMPLAKAVKKVLEGEITHSPSALLILKAKAFLENEGKHSQR